MITQESKPEVSADERQRQLWTASRRYMLGEIKMEELEEVEKYHDLQIRKAVLKLARHRSKQHVPKKIMKPLKKQPLMFIIGLGNLLL